MNPLFGNDAKVKAAIARECHTVARNVRPIGRYATNKADKYRVEAYINSRMYNPYTPYSFYVSLVGKNRLEATMIEL